MTADEHRKYFHDMVRMRHQTTTREDVVGIAARLAKKWAAVSLMVVGIVMAGGEVADPYWPWVNLFGAGLIVVVGLGLALASEG